ncbi:MAG: FecR domain-containing protein [Cytophagales bacterium]|nr:FecR domain-containing protein [Cytophagales bacterium]
MKDSERIKTLFKLFLRDECSPNEAKELFSYINKKRGFHELDPLLDEVWSKLKTYPTLENQHRQYLFGRIKNRIADEKPRRRNLRPLKIAAAAGVFMMAAMMIFFFKDEDQAGKIESITKTTQFGQRASYILPDSSKVSLNAASSITFPPQFKGDRRVVQLKGEAFFEIVKNKRQPFIVESAGIRTKVLGTSFNIRAYQGEDIEVTVATGKVHVESLDKLSPQNNEEILLTANEQAIYDPVKGRLSQLTVDSRKYLAWHSKELILENKSVKDVIVMLEKRFDQKIILENGELGNCVIRKARYEKESLETILKGLQSFLDLKYEFNGYNQWIITGKGCQ